MGCYFSVTFMALAGYFSCSFSKMRGSKWISFYISTRTPFSTASWMQSCSTFVATLPRWEGMLGPGKSGDGHHEMSFALRNVPRCSSSCEPFFLHLQESTWPTLPHCTAEQHGCPKAPLPKPSHQCVGPAGICHSQGREGWFVLSELLPNPACEKAAKPHQDIYTLCLIIICHLWILDF